MFIIEKTNKEIINLTLLGQNVKNREEIENLEKFFSKSGLKKDEILKRLECNDNIKIKIKEEVKRIEPIKKSVKKD